MYFNQKAKDYYNHPDGDEERLNTHTVNDGEMEI